MSIEKKIINDLKELLPKNIEVCRKDYMTAPRLETAKFYEGAMSAYAQILELIDNNLIDDKVLDR